MIVQAAAACLRRLRPEWPPGSRDGRLHREVEGLPDLETPRP